MVRGNNMAALPEQKRGSGVDLVERGLERLGIATQLATEGSSSSNNMAEDSSRAAEDSTDSAPGEAGSVVRSMHGAIRITDIDPLSIDLAAAITRLLEQIGSGCSATAVPAAGSDIVRRLGAWAQAPKHETTGDVLNQLSALLLAEGFDGDTLAALPTDGLPSAARWGDGQFTLAVGAAFRPILIDLVARWAAAEAPAAVFRHLSAHAASERVDVGVAYAAGCLVATAPQTRSLVMRYFAARGGACIAQQAVAAQDAAQALRVLVVAYRLLRRVPELAGSGACGWAAPLTQLMGPDRAPAVRMVACACLCVAQGFSDHGRARLVASMRLDGAAVAGTLAWLVHGERAFDAAAGAALVAANRAGDFSAAANRSVPQELLSSGVACAGGVLLASAGAARAGAGLVETPAVARNIHGMALAASRGAAVLLQGAAGSGKTALVAWLARRAGVELVTIHVSSSMDAKVLLGNYVTTQAAGGFEWRAGLLTTAVAEGHWVLIEDVDLAPSDVVQTLVPLLESNTLFVPSRGEAVPAHVHFRLFATLSTHGARGARAGADGLLGSSVWTRVEIAPLDSEMPLIIAGVFPPLAPHADMLAQAFGRVAAAAGLPLSTGDLLKWCRRLSAYGNDTFSLFKEAVDAFAMREADYTRWRAAVHAIGTVFGLSRQRVDTHIDQSSPTTSTSGRVLRIGRASLGIEDSAAPAAAIDRMPFADTHHARSLLERIAACVQLGEPALLSGETGTGKTTVVQHLASLAGRPLAVFNLSQQSDSSDLLGGFRPVDVALLALRLREEFDPLFARTVSVSKNAAFLDNVRVAHGKKDWRRLAALLRKAADNAAKVLDAARQAVECGSDAGPALKRQKVSAESIDELEKAWASFKAQVADFEAARGAKMVFRFVEGALVRAARSGTWILLDEINLATAETLACLGGLLQRERTLLLAETGVRIACHPDFRLIACMNPANDVGKRELPPGLRSSFTEIFVHPPDASSDDLLAIVRSHLPANAPPAVCHRVIAFYRAAKRLAAEHRLVDGAAQRPHYSLRTLTRSLTYARENAAAYSLKRALYDGLFMMFVTQLEAASQAVLVAELHAVFHGDDIRQLLARAPPPPPSSSAAEAPVLVQGFWLPAAPAAADVADAEADDSYVITASVEAKIKSLARAVMCGRYPVLIQGPTSAGKTSMVQHLARRTGHRFVRINNHEHTDLQEYLGSYASVDGRLVFEEGLLVKALRHGHWLVLDELNLAPSDVLEALNRLLDDNRELVIPETLEIVRPHPHFMLFATQNPAGLYGGRKALSRAFRNRFVELHFDDIPERELQQIIVDSCKVPPTHASLLVDVYRNLTQARAQTRIFEASHGFITLRDLFRWANRHAVTKAELAEHGYMLIAERVRTDDEKAVVRRAIERAFYKDSSVRRGAIDVSSLYSEARLRQMPEFTALAEQHAEIAWTKAMRRLFILTALCLRFHEPVLLVGDTGCGKTTVCQMLAHALQRRLHIVNCHQNTESSDILGGQRPVRNRAALLASARAILVSVMAADSSSLSAELLSETGVDSPEALRELLAAWAARAPDAHASAIEARAEELGNARELVARAQDLFAWHDGPLVQAMRQGDVFLMDELNLADDSVLERLNSVLEPSRTLVLAEQSGGAALTAHPGFEFVATMNPGGDYGKRELSPALRNRFTELWAPTTTDAEDLQLILAKRLHAVPDANTCIHAILRFVAYLQDDLKVLAHPLSLRDYLFWADFIVRTHGLMDARSSVVHGACLVLLDGIGTQGSPLAVSSGGRTPAAVKADCVARLRAMVGWPTGCGAYELGVVPAAQVPAAAADLASLVVSRDGSVGVAPFLVAQGPLQGAQGGFALHAPTTFDNLVKILRAMQVGKPLLLEGSPGVGKTTLVSTLARVAGHRLVRINLSDQTDLMDLFGTDLPVDDGFAWCDAPFLQALKQGDWVLLDEINLASQSVLEGLNSCLDHRATVYISELDREFSLSPGFRLFAAQNPLGQGGGRKGLPRSFVNRFTQVYMDELARDDLQIICDSLYSSHPTIERVLEFNWRMHQETMVRRTFGLAGAPWEFNLRDVSRFMDLALAPSPLEATPKPVDEYVAMLYVHRMRSELDRRQVVELFAAVFGRKLELPTPSLHMTEHTLQIGAAVVRRRAQQARALRLRVLHWQLPYLESLAKCIEMKWLAILVGPAGAGKTALVRWLANATGNKLVEFSMNSGVDTSEILGGFEQVDAQRHRSALLRRVDSLLAAAILGADYQHPGLGVSQACALYQAARNCEDAQDLCALVEQIAQYADDCGDLRLAELAAGVRCDAEAFAGLKVAGKFEWVDGVLVEALIHGHWLLIDRANLCSASVLDRLNGLLEPNGVLSVNEDPKRTEPIQPHPDFRIVMAVDPQYGELSRAMRNRGIEICVLPPSRELCEHGALHGVAVAQAVGLPLPLLPAAVATEPSLTSVVQQSAHIAECVQRGYTAELLLAPSDSSSAALVLARSPDPLESAVSEACWLAAMMEQAVGGEQSALQRERMLLAVLAAASPSADALTMRALQAIVRSDSVARLVAAPLTQAVVEAREQLAAEMGADRDVLVAGPLHMLLNHGLARALDRCAGGLAAQRHHVLTESLHFQRERLVRSGDPAIDDVRELVLQRPSVDVTHVQAVFGLAEGCMRLVADWDAALLLGDPPLKAELLPALRAVNRLRVRVVELMGLERGAGSSALAVAFEGLAAPLALLADGGMRGSGELLAAARSLELDASHSTRAWAAAHPTTLPDDASRALEARLAAAVRAVSQVEPALRDAAIEALAMLYATAGRRDRHLVVAAITRFAQVLPQITGVTEGADETAVGPAAALGDVGELATWRAMAQVAACAGSLPGDSDVGRRLVQALRGSVAATAVGAESAWALLFTRLAWAANDARASALLLPVTGDVDYQWHTRLGDSRLAALLAEPAHRLARPVATELAWAQAARFDCALGDHERAARESVELLRAVTVHRELPAPTAAAAAELAVLAAAVVQTAQAIGGDDVAAFVRASEQLLDVLIPGDSAEVVLPVAGELLDAWQRALPAAAGVVEPAARAVRAALEAEAANREALVLGAAVEVGLCQLRVAVPRRAVDPAARARTQWAWLGDEAGEARADLAAYQLIQRSMTGSGDDSAAVRPLVQRVAALEQQRAGIQLVYRPGDGSAGRLFAELWQEAHNLCGGVLARVRDVCAQLTQAPAAELPRALGAAAALLGTLEQFEGRVARRYFDAFRDVAQLWVACTRRVAHAVSRLADLRRGDAHGAVREHAAAAAALYAQPMARRLAETDIAQLRTLIFFSAGATAPLAVYGDLLVAYATRAVLGVQARGSVGAADLSALEAVFRDAYEMHRRAADERKRRDAEAGSVFRHRARADPTDEELLGEMFPGFEDVLDDAADAGDAAAQPGFQDVPEAAVAALAACHQHVMLQFGGCGGGRGDIQAALIGQAQRAAFRVAAALQRMRPELAQLLGAGADGPLRGANMLGVAAVAASSADAGPSTPCAGLRVTSVYDFYRDAAPGEAARLRPVAQAIALRAQQLLDEWPEHAVLEQIRDMAQRVLLLPVAAPVAKLLAAVEQLHARAQDWEAYASRAVSIAELGDAARLIVRWRQQELHAWPHLLRAQELAFARRPGAEWWLQLYAALAAGEAADFALLVACVDQFMQGAPAGEFRGRLNMLRAFAAHRVALLRAGAARDGASLADARRRDAVLGPLANAVDYYAQFAPCVGEQLARAKKAVAGDLAQYVKISAWKDVNPAALRASAQKTHKHLAKCVRRWRDALSQPIFQIVQAHQAAAVATARVPSVQIVELPLADAGMDFAPRVHVVGQPAQAPAPMHVDPSVAAHVAQLAASSSDSAVAPVLESSAAALQQLGRMLARSAAFGIKEAESADPLEELALQMVGDVSHFQSVETPKHLVKRPPAAGAKGDNAKKRIIKSRKQKANDEAAGDAYVEDDDERQRRIRQFWGEQRNLRRTRLTELLKALHALGLRRHARAAPTDSESAGLGAVLRHPPLDVDAWHAAAATAAMVGAVPPDAARRTWQLASAGFFRLCAASVQLRAATFAEHSPEVGAQQVLLIAGLADSLARVADAERAAAAALLADATAWMHAAVAWGSGPANSASGSADSADSASGPPAIDILKELADGLALLVAQFLGAARVVGDAGGWGSDAPRVAQAAAAIEAAAAAHWAPASAALAAAQAAAEALLATGLPRSDVAQLVAAFEQTASAAQAVRQAAATMQEAFAALDLPAALAESWVQPIAAQLARILDLCAAEPGPRAGGAEDGGVELAAAAGQWVTAVMHAWQTMHRAEESLEAALGAERNEWGLRPKELVRRSEFMQAAARGLHLPTMLELWRRLTSLACAAGAAHVVTAFVRPWVAQYSRLVQRVVAMYGERHRATVQFALTVTSVLTTVLLHGLGSNDMYDGEDTDESMQTGTGIGEGSTAGAKNVSDEIEGEDQVEGLQGEEGQDNEEEDPGNNEDAIDMQNDFDGKLGDADLQTDDDNSSDESDDDGEDDMDEQMGDVDPTDPTALDDKLWDDEEEKDEKEQKGEDSKVDSKASKKKDKSDIVAGTGSDDEDSGSDGGEQPEPESGSEQADDDNGSGDDDGGDAEEGDDGEEDSEGELDDRVNKDTLNRMADVEDLAEQLEMPDDLDMGGDDDAESDEEDDGLDADMNELPEDEPIDPFDPSAQPEDAEAEDAKAEGDEHSAAEADAAAAEEESAEAMEADDGASGSEAGSDGGEDQDGDDEGEKDGADEEAADPEEDTEAGGPEPDEPREAEAEDAAKSGANKPTDGIDSAMNLDGSDEAAPNASAESQQQQMKAMQSSSQQQQRQPDQQQMQAEQSQGMPDGAANDRGADSQPQLQQPQEKQRNLQPERTLADVIEKWERRLDLVMRDEEETAAEEETEGAVEEQGAPESDDAAAAPESSAHEHVKPDEAFDRVALADATEAELAQQQERPPMDVEERGSGEQEADAEDMDVDGEKAEKEPLGHEPPRDAGPPQSAEQPAEQQARPAMASMQRSAADEPGGVEAEGMDVDAEPAAEAEAEADGSDPEPEEVDVDRLRAELEERTAAWRAGADAEQEQAAQLWRGYTRVTHDLALVLTEQLRLILAPTQATQLRGDFRTGKRLNMKRIIPYIASEFRKDKIWLRRAKPARREYHVILALDNSKSMAQAPRAVELAYETLALVATALAQLDVGHIAVVAFGDAVRLLHPFDRPFDADAGARVLRHLTFADDRTDVVQLMDASLRLYDDAAAALSSSSSADLWRLQLVISDGVCQDHPRLLRQVRAAMEQRIMTVFIVLDRSALTDADPEKDSIMNTQHVSFVNGEMRVERYLDTFPFKFYVVLRDIHGLPAVLAETLRQYFSLVGSE